MTNQVATRFLILGAPRTGTTMLVSLLGSHPDVACYGEIYNSAGGNDKVIDGVAEITPEILQRLFERGVHVDWKNPNDRPSHRMWTTPHEGRVQAVGFKLLSNQWRGSAAIRYLTEDLAIRVIRVRRRNALAAVVSGINAVQRRVFNSSRASDAVTKPVHVRLEMITRWVREDRIWSMIERVFEGHPQLEITYEDLIARRDEVCAGLLQFLGVTARELTTDTVKLGLPLREAVTNWHELREQARGTELEAFFEE